MSPAYDDLQAATDLLQRASGLDPGASLKREFPQAYGGTTQDKGVGGLYTVLEKAPTRPGGAGGGRREPSAPQEAPGVLEAPRGTGAAPAAVGGGAGSHEA